MAHFGFGKMLAKLRDGFLTTRLSWPQKVFLEKEEGLIWKVDGDPSEIAGKREPWRPESGDVLAVDWMVAESKK